MAGILSLVVSGVVAVTLGVLGSVALASSMSKPTPAPTETANVRATVPGVYGSR